MVIVKFVWDHAMDYIQIYKYFNILFVELE